MHSLPRKEPGIALILSLLVTGFGHFYVGGTLNITKGIVFLCCQIFFGVLTLLIIGWPLLIMLWIYAAADAYSAAKAYNRELGYPE